MGAYSPPINATRIIPDIPFYYRFRFGLPRYFRGADSWYDVRQRFFKKETGISLNGGSTIVSWRLARVYPHGDNSSEIRANGAGCGLGSWTDCAQYFSGAVISGYWDEPRETTSDADRSFGEVLELLFPNSSMPLGLKRNGDPSHDDYRNRLRETADE